jgi:transcriptional regulator with XRE-family HTH domain
MDLKAINLKVGSLIESKRLAKGLSQEETAKNAGLSRASFINMECGRQAVSLKRLFDIAIELDVDILELLPTKEWYSENKDKKLRRVVTIEMID